MRLLDLHQGQSSMTSDIWELCQRQWPVLECIVLDDGKWLTQRALENRLLLSLDL